MGLHHDSRYCRGSVQIPMTRTPVTSSNVKSVGYDPNTRTLEVEFNSSGVYQYGNVSEDEYQSVLQADSVGKAVNQIKVGREAVRV